MDLLDGFVGWICWMDLQLTIDERFHQILEIMLAISFHYHMARVGCCFSNLYQLGHMIIVLSQQ